MRMHIELDDELIHRLDTVGGPRGRSAFVRRAIELAIRDEERWAQLERAAGAIPDSGHGWDGDPARWVQAQRQGDVQRGG